MVLENEFGVIYNLKTIRRLMKKFNLVCLHRKRNPYKLSDRITLSIATETIDAIAKQKRVKLHKDAFIHSDQGSHYTSPQYQLLLQQNGLGQSMSRRGNCWDNASQELVFGHMKDYVKSRCCSSLSELQRAIDRYIRYYSNHWYQWVLKKMNPVQYEATEKVHLMKKRYRSSFYN